MFRVEADSLQAYLDFDTAREPDLVRLHALMRGRCSPRWRAFSKRTPRTPFDTGKAGDRVTAFELDRPNVE
ncbi:MAG: hypothetical protein ACM3II_08790 [Rhodospirillaceae bacterium]